ncbi:S8 family serine peptidase [Rheinheimera texasensis]|uniref:S8 family serine peptidase n=1 Tax=Rheinheimera texasensis TaxID=306205 RepID=UPI00068BC2DE|nr:S8 family serine peptidase [Rheinheimera texasensis]
MKHFAILSSMLGLAGVLMPAYADETVRLVFNQQQAISQSQTTSQNVGQAGCVSTPDGLTQWCIPAGEAKANSAAGTEPLFAVHELPAHGYDASYIAHLFTQSGQFGVVEADLITSARPVETMDMTVESDSTQINDPYFTSYQLNRYFASPSKANVGSGIIDLWNMVGLPAVLEPKDPIDLVFIDSEFETSKEVTYHSGRSLTTTALTKGGPFQKPNDDFSVRPEVDDVCDAHGLQVIATASAKTNNEFGGAGITNNVNRHAIRSMTCGTGFLSDSANSLLFLAGKPFKDSNLVTPYAGKPGIINMSLGSKSESCPVYLQTAIDEAIKAGFTIVVSAGNEGADTGVKSPANCRGVIVVGALDTDGTIASYSNTGKEVDVMAQGSWIPVPCEDNDEKSTYCFSSGTSFSAPVVSGVLATVKRETGVDDDTLKLALLLTSESVRDARCDVKDTCGAGRLNAAGVMGIARLAKAGGLNRIEHALGSKTECEQIWLLDHFGQKARLCNLFKVTFMNGVLLNNVSYQLVSIPKGEQWDKSTPAVVGTFTQAEVQLGALTPDTLQYGMQVCENGACGEVLVMNTDKATSASKPAACK